MPSTLKDHINADLLAFIKAWHQQTKEKSMRKLEWKIALISPNGDRDINNQSLFSTV